VRMVAVALVIPPCDDRCILAARFEFCQMELGDVMHRCVSPLEQTCVITHVDHSL